MFWSDLGPKVGYEALGIIDSTLPTVSVFAKVETDGNIKTIGDLKAKAGAGDTPATPIPDKNVVNAVTKTTEQSKKEDGSKDDGDDFSKGVVFYLRNDKIVGIVLWNVFNRINTARAVIAESAEKKYDDLNDVAKLFDIHT